MEENKKVNENCQSDGKSGGDSGSDVTNNFYMEKNLQSYVFFTLSSILGIAFGILALIFGLYLHRSIRGILHALLLLPAISFIVSFFLAFVAFNIARIICYNKYNTDKNIIKRRLKQYLGIAIVSKERRLKQIYGVTVASFICILLFIPFSVILLIWQDLNRFLSLFLLLPILPLVENIIFFVTNNKIKIQREEAEWFAAKMEEFINET